MGRIKSVFSMRCSNTRLPNKLSKSKMQLFRHSSCNSSSSRYSNNNSSKHSNNSNSSKHSSKHSNNNSSNNCSNNSSNNNSSNNNRMLQFRTNIIFLPLHLPMSTPLLHHNIINMGWILSNISTMIHMARLKFTNKSISISFRYELVNAPRHNSF